MLATRCFRLSAIAFLSAAGISEPDLGPQASAMTIAPITPSQKGRETLARRGVNALMSERYTASPGPAPSRNGDNSCLSLVTLPLKTSS